MVLLAAFMLLGNSQLATASEPLWDANEPEITQEGRTELQQLLERETVMEKVDVTPGTDRKPAVLGAATSEPSERREMYLDYSDSVPEGSTEPQR